MLPPKKFKTVKQPLGSHVCGACVAAMATGQTLEEVVAELTPTYLAADPRPFYRTRDLLGYLGQRGIFCGLIFRVGGQLTDEEHSRITHDGAIANHPAIVLVRSEVYRNAHHLVFWDGRAIRDPNPRLANTTRLDHYHVLEWWPLTYLDDSAELDAEHLMELLPT